MTLSQGAKLGSYEILGPLGAGGMGEVYRARDSKLGREVALKVLPEEFARDAEHMARFEREAQVLASLNDPNIASIYGVEESGTVNALVMELVEGSTLAERIAKGPMPIDEALETARQIAEGLEYAHERGIVHRDLKPANVKVTPEGSVKILDFGLAKALETEDSASDITTSPTVSIGATHAGVILGTAAYMSPEQAKGKKVDRRADIWAFGCILFEMLSGKYCFQSDSVSETLAAVLMKDPDWTELPESTPPRLKDLLRRCLTKDAKQRLRDIGEARIAIEEMLNGPKAGPVSSPPQPPAPAAAGPRRNRLAALVPAIALVVPVAIASWLVGRKTSVFVPPEFHQLTFDSGLIYSARFAPEGNTIYYSAGWNGRAVQLYVTYPNGPESRPMGVEDSSLFAVSPSQMAISIGCKDMFIGDCSGTLAVEPISGGAPRELAENVISADWGADGNELAAIRQVGQKFEVEFPLGKVLYQSSSWLGFLRISPGGHAVAFVAYDTLGGDVGKVIVLGRDGSEIIRSKTFVSIEGLVWTPRGKEIWFGAATSTGWANSIHALSLSGEDRIVLRTPGPLRLHDCSRDGRVLLTQEMWRDSTRFRSAADAKEVDLSWLDSSDVADLAPDGKDIAFFNWGLANVESAAYMRRTDGSPPVKLGNGQESVFSPDRKWLLVTVPGNPSRLALLPTGAGERRELDISGVHQLAAPGWLPSGEGVYFAGNDGHDWRLYTLDLAGGAPRAFTPSVSLFANRYESHLVSPDGKWAFARDLNAKGWLYPLAGGSPEALEGLTPRDAWINWSGDGRCGYVYDNDTTRAQVFRIQIANGNRQLVTELGPSDPAALTSVLPVRVTPDARFFAYSFDRALSNLFLVTGVK